MRRHYRSILSCYIFTLVQIPLGLVESYVINKMVDQTLNAKKEYDRNAQLMTLGIIVIIKILNSLAFELNRRFVAKQEGIINNEMFSDVFKSIVRRDISEFDRYGASQLEGMVRRTNNVSVFLIKRLPEIVQNILRIPGILYMMYALEPSLSSIALVTLPLMIVVQYREITTIMEFYAENRNQKVLGNAIESHMSQVFRTIRNVRSFGCEQQEVRAIDEKLEEKLERTVAVSYKKVAYQYASGILRNSVKYVGYLYGAHLISMGELTPLTFLAFKSYQAELTSRSRAISGMFSPTVYTMDSVRRAFSFVGKENEMKRNGELRPNLKGEIELKSVNFAYCTRPNEQILKDLNLHVKAGESVALVGASGSGKSTIVNLVERFYDPIEGVVLVDGVDVRDIDEEYYHKQIALVAQEPVLYNMSIRENILYGCDWATEEDMIEAATQANAHSFINKLKKGYDTKCGDSGAQLSGGQKQRIAIARALVRRPTFLLLDEATSALDTESESVVQEALERCCKDITTIVIAHRLSTIRNVDKIAVISEGRVAEFGSHDTLMMLKDGQYASLVDLQMKGFKVTSIEKTLATMQKEQNALEKEKNENSIPKDL